MTISGDLVRTNSDSYKRARLITETIELALLSTGILHPQRQDALDYTLSRRVNLVIKVPYSHKSDKSDIEKTYKEQARELVQKLPYFEYINVAVKLVKTSASNKLSLDEVRNELMSELSHDHLSISIYLTENHVHEFEFVQTNDRKYGTLQQLKNLDSKSAKETLSFFLLRILNIVPNKLVYQKAKVAGVELNIASELSRNELENFLKVEQDTKRYLILYHLAATGWITDENHAMEKMKEYENLSVKEISHMEEREKPIEPDLYSQMEFPISFQIALFFTFYTPLLFRFGRIGLGYLKKKVKG